MKRILITLAAAALLAGCSEDRSQILKVYNWSDYIDESVIPEFEQWYEEQTGEKVKVIYPVRSLFVPSGAVSTTVRVPNGIFLMKQT